MDFPHSKIEARHRTVAEVATSTLTTERIDSARAEIDAIAALVPAITKYSTTPQTPPAHAEGPMVIDHTVRIFALIDAIASGASLHGCADLVNDDVINFALADAEAAIRESPKVFKAYALMHDVAKPDRLLLVAAPGTAGEKEGFVRSNKRASEFTTSSELARFYKLRRANLADGIEATFGDADKAIIAPQYESVRAAIVKACGLEVAYTKFIAELCWSHRDLEEFFITPGNESAFLTFPARAGKAGINVERFLNALLAIALLDHDLGRSRLAPRASLFTFHRLATAEHAAMPERHAAREARHAHQKKLRVKEILSEHQLDPNQVFPMLGTPLGPERGVVMHAVYAVIRGESAADSFGVHAHVIEERCLKARAALDLAGLSV
jgi:hypothetical protein